jgi:hypothetical protein
VVHEEVSAREEAVLAARLLLGEDLDGRALLVKPGRHKNVTGSRRGSNLATEIRLNYIKLRMI